MIFFKVAKIDIFEFLDDFRSLRNEISVLKIDSRARSIDFNAFLGIIKKKKIK